MSIPAWIQSFPGAITVCDVNGTIVEMNDQAAQVFASSGGHSLIGTDLFACHSEASRQKLRGMMDLRIFVDADPDERLIRVIQRDVIERGRTAEAVMERYTRILKPMHLQFIEPCKRYADLIVPEGGNNQVAIDILTMYIKKHL